MKIIIIGAGYVGLPAAVGFAEFGHDVVVVDNNQEKIAQLKRGVVPLFEPLLTALIKKHCKRKKITFATDITRDIDTAQIIIIAVGTPTNPATNRANLDYLHGSIDMVTQQLEKKRLEKNGASTTRKTIVIKSTVPIGTNDNVADNIKKQYPKINVDVVSVPEFLREGHAVEDFMQPERLVIGIEDDKAKAAINKLYQPLLKKKIPVVYCNRKTAETIKYAANSFLAMKVSYINQLADLCEKTGADIRPLQQAIGLDSRIGEKFLNPGPGFGGSCFPKDMLELIGNGEEIGIDLSLVKTAMNYNQMRFANLANKIIAISQHQPATPKTIAMLGIAFKANTDDIRMSPAIEIINHLLKNNVIVTAFDPAAMDNGRAQLPQIYYGKDISDAIQNADALVIATEWSVFKKNNFHQVIKTMKGKVVIDLRNVLSTETIKAIVAAGLSYYPVGYKL